MMKECVNEYNGYNEAYRLQILKAGMMGYDRMLEVEREGGRPVNRPRSWEEDRRQMKKDLQSKTWYRKGGFDVPLLASQSDAHTIAPHRDPNPSQSQSHL